jgi:glycosyltransferase involved in cell wall biosynthesis
VQKARGQDAKAIGRKLSVMNGRFHTAIDIVTFTTLYPNAAQPHHGVFVENRLRHLVDGAPVLSRVVAPVPWFPFASPRFGAYAAYARIAAVEQRFGLPVLHPRYLTLPRIGMNAAPWLLYAACLPLLRRLQREHDFDLIDAHYFYPDGVAAALLGRALGKPVVITARGTDVNLIPRYRLPRRMIRWAAGRAAGIVTVSQALKEAVVGLGVAADKITVLRNGVDLAIFHPGGREAGRAQLGLNGPTLLSVGHLIERKGHDLVIGALADLPDFSLLIAGEGPERARLASLVGRLGLGARVRFLGSVPHEGLQRVYAAADALVLASSREGWPNVLLEAMASGTPVLASNIWGNPEVVSCPEAGLLFDERTSAAIADGVRRLFARGIDREATRRYAEQFSWDATTEGQYRLFEGLLAGQAGADRMARMKAAET